MRIFPKLLRAFAGSLTLIYFLTNCAWAHLPQTTIWEERQNHLRMTPSPLMGEGGERVTPHPSLSHKGRGTELDSIISALPAQFGSVRKIVKRNGPAVVLIQDIHRNTEAQANIGKTIRSLAEKNLVGMLALEGSTEKIDLSAYKEFPDQTIVKQVADELLAEFKISGAIHAALTTPSSAAADPVIIGIDDAVHYEANVEAVRESFKVKEKAQKESERWGKDLNGRKKAVTNPELWAFDQKAEEYEAGKVELAQFLNELEPITHYAQLQVYGDAAHLESTLDFARVERDRSELLARLLPKLKQAESQFLISQSVSLRLGQLSPADFYGNLEKLCRAKGVSLDKTPAMKSYLKYLTLADGIDSEKLFEEVRMAREARYQQLARTPVEKALVQESRQYILANKLLEFSLSPEEWSEYKELNRHSALNPSRRTVPLGTEPNLSTFEEFYKQAEIRDNLMAKNILDSDSRLKDSLGRNEGVSVVVAGGFHSPGLIRALSDADYTVISFVPRITTLNEGPRAQGSEGSYLSVFTQQKTPLEELFAGQKLFLPENPRSHIVHIDGSVRMATAGFLAGLSTMSWLQKTLQWSEVQFKRVGSTVSLAGAFIGQNDRLRKFKLILKTSAGRAPSIEKVSPGSAPLFAPSSILYSIFARWPIGFYERNRKLVASIGMLSAIIEGAAFTWLFGSPDEIVGAGFYFLFIFIHVLTDASSVRRLYGTTRMIGHLTVVGAYGTVYHYWADDPLMRALPFLFQLVWDGFWIARWDEWLFRPQGANDPRPISWDDIDQMVSVEKDSKKAEEIARKDEVEAKKVGNHRMWGKQRFENALKMGSQGWVVEMTDPANGQAKLVGYAIFHWEGSRMHITNLVVHPDHYGEGYGRMLMGKCIEDLHEVNGSAIVTYVDDSSSYEGRFYEGVDFLPWAGLRDRKDHWIRNSLNVYADLYAEGDKEKTITDLKVRDAERQEFFRFLELLNKIWFLLEDDDHQEKSAFDFYLNEPNAGAVFSWTPAQFKAKRELLKKILGKRAIDQRFLKGEIIIFTSGKSAGLEQAELSEFLGSAIRLDYIASIASHHGGEISIEQKSQVRPRSVFRITFQDFEKLQEKLFHTWPYKDAIDFVLRTGLLSYISGVLVLISLHFMAVAPFAVPWWAPAVARGAAVFGFVLGLVIIHLNFYESHYLIGIDPDSGKEVKIFQAVHRPPTHSEHVLEVRSPNDIQAKDLHRGSLYFHVLPNSLFLLNLVVMIFRMPVLQTQTQVWTGSLMWLAATLIIGAVVLMADYKMHSHWNKESWETGRVMGADPKKVTEVLTQGQEAKAERVKQAIDEHAKVYEGLVPPLSKLAFLIGRLGLGVEDFVAVDLQNKVIRRKWMSENRHVSWGISWWARTELFKFLNEAETTKKQRYETVKKYVTTDARFHENTVDTFLNLISGINSAYWQRWTVLMTFEQLTALQEYGRFAVAAGAPVFQQWGTIFSEEPSSSYKLAEDSDLVEVVFRVPNFLVEQEDVASSSAGLPHRGWEQPLAPREINLYTVQQQEELEKAFDEGEMAEMELPFIHLESTRKILDSRMHSGHISKERYAAFQGVLDKIHIKLHPIKTIAKPVEPEAPKVEKIDNPKIIMPPASAVKPKSTSRHVARKNSFLRNMMRSMAADLVETERKEKDKENPGDDVPPQATLMSFVLPFFLLSWADSSLLSDLIENLQQALNAADPLTMLLLLLMFPLGMVRESSSNLADQSEEFAKEVMKLASYNAAVSLIKIDLGWPLKEIKHKHQGVAVLDQQKPNGVIIRLHNTDSFLVSDFLAEIYRKLVIQSRESRIPVYFKAKEENHVLLIQAMSSPQEENTLSFFDFDAASEAAERDYSLRLLSKLDDAHDASKRKLFPKDKPATLGQFVEKQEESPAAPQPEPESEPVVSQPEPVILPEVDVQQSEPAVEAPQPAIEASDELSQKIEEPVVSSKRGGNFGTRINNFGVFVANSAQMKPGIDQVIVRLMGPIEEIPQSFAQFARFETPDKKAVVINVKDCSREELIELSSYLYQEMNSQADQTGKPISFDRLMPRNFLILRAFNSEAEAGHHAWYTYRPKQVPAKSRRVQNPTVSEQAEAPLAEPEAIDQPHVAAPQTAASIIDQRLKGKPEGFAKAVILILEKAPNIDSINFDFGIEVGELPEEFSEFAQISRSNKNQVVVRLDDCSTEQLEQVLAYLYERILVDAVESARPIYFWGFPGGSRFFIQRKSKYSPYPPLKEFQYDPRIPLEAETEPHKPEEVSGAQTVISAQPEEVIQEAPIGETKRKRGRPRKILPAVEIQQMDPVQASASVEAGETRQSETSPVVETKEVEPEKSPEEMAEAFAKAVLKIVDEKGGIKSIDVTMNFDTKKIPVPYNSFAKVNKVTARQVNIKFTEEKRNEIAEYLALLYTAILEDSRQSKTPICFRVGSIKEWLSIVTFDKPQAKTEFSLSNFDFNPRVRKMKAVKVHLEKPSPAPEVASPAIEVPVVQSAEVETKEAEREEEIPVSQPPAPSVRDEGAEKALISDIVARMRSNIPVSKKKADPQGAQAAAGFFATLFMWVATGPHPEKPPKGDSKADNNDGSPLGFSIFGQEWYQASIEREQQGIQQFWIPNKIVIAVGFLEEIVLRGLFTLAITAWLEYAAPGLSPPLAQLYFIFLYSFTFATLLHPTVVKGTSGIRKPATINDRIELFMLALLLGWISASISNPWISYPFIGAVHALWNWDARRTGGVLAMARVPRHTPASLEEAESTDRLGRVENAAGNRSSLDEITSDIFDLLQIQTFDYRKMEEGDWIELKVVSSESENKAALEHRLKALLEKDFNGRPIVRHPSPDTWILGPESDSFDWDGEEVVHLVKSFLEQAAYDPLNRRYNVEIYRKNDGVQVVINRKSLSSLKKESQDADPVVDDWQPPVSAGVSLELKRKYVEAHDFIARRLESRSSFNNQHIPSLTILNLRELDFIPQASAKVTKRAFLDPLIKLEPHEFGILTLTEKGPNAFVLPFLGTGIVFSIRAKDAEGRDTLMQGVVHFYLQVSGRVSTEEKLAAIFNYLKQKDFTDIEISQFIVTSSSHLQEVYKRVREDVATVMAECGVVPKNWDATIIHNDTQGENLLVSMNTGEAASLSLRSDEDAYTHDILVFPYLPKKFRASIYNFESHPSEVDPPASPSSELQVPSLQPFPEKEELSDLDGFPDTVAPLENAELPVHDEDISLHFAQTILALIKESQTAEELIINFDQPISGELDHFPEISQADLASGKVEIDLNHWSLRHLTDVLTIFYERILSTAKEFKSPVSFAVLVEPRRISIRVVNEAWSQGRLFDYHYKPIKTRVSKSSKTTQLPKAEEPQGILQKDVEGEPAAAAEEPASLNSDYSIERILALFDARREGIVGPDKLKDSEIPLVPSETNEAPQQEPVETKEVQSTEPSVDMAAEFAQAALKIVDEKGGIKLINVTMNFDTKKIPAPYNSFAKVNKVTARQVNIKFTEEKRNEIAGYLAFLYNAILENSRQSKTPIYFRVGNLEDWISIGTFDVPQAKTALSAFDFNPRARKKKDNKRDITLLSITPFILLFWPWEDFASLLTSILDSIDLKHALLALLLFPVGIFIRNNELSDGDEAANSFVGEVMRLARQDLNVDRISIDMGFEFRVPGEFRNFTGSNVENKNEILIILDAQHREQTQVLLALLYKQIGPLPFRHFTTRDTLSISFRKEEKPVPAPADGEIPDLVPGTDGAASTDGDVLAAIDADVAKRLTLPELAEHVITFAGQTKFNGASHKKGEWVRFEPAVEREGFDPITITEPKEGWESLGVFGQLRGYFETLAAKPGTNHFPLGIYREMKGVRVVIDRNAVEAAESAIPVVQAGGGSGFVEESSFHPIKISTPLRRHIFQVHLSLKRMFGLLKEQIKERLAFVKVYNLDSAAEPHFYLPGEAVPLVSVQKARDGMHVIIAEKSQLVVSAQSHFENHPLAVLVREPGVVINVRAKGAGNHAYLMQGFVEFSSSGKTRPFPKKIAAIVDYLKAEGFTDIEFSFFYFIQSGTPKSGYEDLRSEMAQFIAKKNLPLIGWNAQLIPLRYSWTRPVIAMNTLMAASVQLPDPYDSGSDISVLPYNKFWKNEDFESFAQRPIKQSAPPSAPEISPVARTPTARVSPPPFERVPAFIDTSELGVTVEPVREKKIASGPSVEPLKEEPVNIAAPAVSVEVQQEAPVEVPAIALLETREVPPEEPSIDMAAEFAKAVMKIVDEKGGIKSIDVTMNFDTKKIPSPFKSIAKVNKVTARQVNIKVSEEKRNEIAEYLALLYSAILEDSRQSKTPIYFRVGSFKEWISIVTFAEPQDKTEHSLSAFDFNPRARKKKEKQVEVKTPPTPVDVSELEPSVEVQIEPAPAQGEESSQADSLPKTRKVKNFGKSINRFLDENPAAWYLVIDFGQGRGNVPDSISKFGTPVRGLPEAVRIDLTKHDRQQVIKIAVAAYQEIIRSAEKAGRPVSFKASSKYNWVCLQVVDTRGTWGFHLFKYKPNPPMGMMPFLRGWYQDSIEREEKGIAQYWTPSRVLFLVSLLQEWLIRGGLHWIFLKIVVHFQFGLSPPAATLVFVFVYALVFAYPFHPTVLRGKNSIPEEASYLDRFVLYLLALSLGIITWCVPNPILSYFVIGFIHSIYNDIARETDGILAVNAKFKVPGLSQSNRDRMRNVVTLAELLAKGVPFRIPRGYQIPVQAYRFTDGYNPKLEPSAPKDKIDYWYVSDLGHVAADFDGRLGIMRIDEKNAGFLYTPLSDHSTIINAKVRSGSGVTFLMQSVVAPVNFDDVSDTDLLFRKLEAIVQVIRSGSPIEVEMSIHAFVDHRDKFNARAIESRFEDYRLALKQSGLDIKPFTVRIHSHNSNVWDIQGVANMAQGVLIRRVVLGERKDMDFTYHVWEKQGDDPKLEETRARQRIREREIARLIAWMKKFPGVRLPYTSEKILEKFPLLTTQIISDVVGDQKRQLAGDTRTLDNGKDDKPAKKKSGKKSVKKTGASHSGHYIRDAFIELRFFMPLTVLALTADWILVGFGMQDLPLKIGIFFGGLLIDLFLFPSVYTSWFVKIHPDEAYEKAREIFIRAKNWDLYREDYDALLQEWHHKMGGKTFALFTLTLTALTPLAWWIGRQQESFLIAFTLAAFVSLIWNFSAHAWDNHIFFTRGPNARVRIGASHSSQPEPEPLRFTVPYLSLRIPVGRQVRAIALSPDGSKVAMAGGPLNRQERVLFPVVIYDIETGASEKVGESAMMRGARIDEVWFSDDGTQLSMAAGDKVRTIGFDDGTLTTKDRGHDGFSRFHSAGDKTIEVRKNGDILVKKAGSNVPLLVLAGIALSNKSVSLSPDGNTLYVGGTDDDGVFDDGFENSRNFQIWKLDELLSEVPDLMEKGGFLESHLLTAQRWMNLRQFVPAAAKHIFDDLPTPGARQAAMLNFYLFHIERIDTKKLLQRMTYIRRIELETRFQNGPQHMMAMEVHTAIPEDGHREHLTQQLFDLMMRVKGNLDENEQLLVRPLFKITGLEIQTLPSNAWEIQAMIWDLWEEVCDAEGINLDFGNYEDTWVQLSVNGVLDTKSSEVLLHRWVAANAEFNKRMHRSLKFSSSNRWKRAWLVRRPKSSRLTGTAPEFLNERTEVTGMIFVPSSNLYAEKRDYGRYRRQWLQDMWEGSLAIKRRHAHPEKWISEFSDLPPSVVGATTGIFYRDDFLRDMWLGALFAHISELPASAFAFIERKFRVMFATFNTPIELDESIRKYPSLLHVFFTRLSESLLPILPGRDSLPIVDGFSYLQSAGGGIVLKPEGNMGEAPSASGYLALMIGADQIHFMNADTLMWSQPQLEGIKLPLMEEIRKRNCPVIQIFDRSGSIFDSFFGLSPAVFSINVERQELLYPTRTNQVFALVDSDGKPMPGWICYVPRARFDPETGKRVPASFVYKRVDTEFSLSPDSYPTEPQSTPNALGFFVARLLGADQQTAVRWGWASLVVEAATLIALPAVFDVSTEWLAGIISALAILHVILRLMLKEHQARGEPLSTFALKAFTLHFLFFSPYLVFSAAFPNFWPSLFLGISAVIVHAAWDVTQFYEAENRKTPSGARPTFIGRFIAAVLYLFTPLVYLIFIPLIKISSPGPVFFHQERVGYQGKPLMITKLRSMTVDINSKTGKKDVTWVGNIMRVPGFDEWPQLPEILKGKMRWFAPRPHLPEEVALVPEYIPELLDETDPGMFFTKSGGKRVGSISDRADAQFLWTEIRGWRNKSLKKNAVIFADVIGGIMVGMPLTLYGMIARKSPEELKEIRNSFLPPAFIAFVAAVLIVYLAGALGYYFLTKPLLEKSPWMLFFTSWAPELASSFLGSVVAQVYQRKVEGEPVSHPWRKTLGQMAGGFITAPIAGFVIHAWIMPHVVGPLFPVITWGFIWQAILSPLVMAPLTYLFMKKFSDPKNPSFADILKKMPEDLWRMVMLAMVLFIVVHTVTMPLSPYSPALSYALGRTGSIIWQVRLARFLHEKKDGAPRTVSYEKYIPSWYKNFHLGIFRSPFLRAYVISLLTIHFVLTAGRFSYQFNVPYGIEPNFSFILALIPPFVLFWIYQFRDKEIDARLTDLKASWALAILKSARVWTLALFIPLAAASQAPAIDMKTPAQRLAHDLFEVAEGARSSRITPGQLTQFLSSQFSVGIRQRNERSRLFHSVDREQLEMALKAEISHRVQWEGMTLAEAHDLMVYFLSLGLRLEIEKDVVRPIAVGSEELLKEEARRTVGWIQLLAPGNKLYPLISHEHREHFKDLLIAQSKANDVDMNGKIGWVDFDGQFVDIEAGSNIRVYHTAAIEEGLHHLMHDHDKNLDSLAIALDAGFQWSNPVFARQSLLDQIGYYLADQILSTAVPLSRMDLELIVTVTSVASKNV